MKHGILGFVVLGLGIVNSAWGSVLVVREDGSGDFDRIVDALLATKDGDEVAVYPGLYDEANEEGKPGIAFIVDRSISLYGVGLASEVQVSGLLVAFFGDEFTCRGMTFSEAGPMIVGGTGRVAIEGCVFEDMFGDGSGAIEFPNGVLDVRDCMFARCRSNFAGAIWGGNMVVAGTTFLECSGPRAAGILGGVTELDGTVFAGCRTEGTTGTIVEALKLRATSCTWWGNDADRAVLLVVNSITFNGLVIESSIMSENEGGSAVETDGGLTVRCSDFFDSGNWQYAALDSTDVLAVDPQFCDPLSLDFQLEATSDCAPGNGPIACDLIGAKGIGCGVTAARYVSWGDVKRIFLPE